MRARIRTGEVQGHKSEWLTPLAGGLVKTQLLVFTTLFTTLFCFLLRYLLRYGRRQRMTFMFFGTFQTACTVEVREKEPLWSIQPEPEDRDSGLEF